jgi:hypothetical protein
MPTLAAALHLRVGNRLNEFGMRQGQRHAFPLQQIPEPVPAGRSFHRGAARRRQLGKVAGHGRARARYRRLAHAAAGFIHRGEHGGSLVQVDSSVQHRGPPGFVGTASCGRQALLRSCS